MTSTATAQGDAAPLSFAQLRALGGAVKRELGWGLREAGRERDAWRRQAERIPDPRIRADALDALTLKQHYSDGAALFWTIPARRDLRLLRLLIAFQIAASFLDHASERGALHRGDTAGSLMLALVDAVDLDTALGDYYADHPWTDDGGYLRALVTTCRSGCATLTGYRQAHDLLVREARLLRALELEHDPDPVRRDAALRRLAVEEFGDATDATWLELAGAASAALTVIVLLALATDEQTTDDDLHEAIDAYTSVGGLATMLDGYVDQVEDAASGEWSSIAYYSDIGVAAERIAYLIDGSLRKVAGLRNGERHTVIVCSMVAMYLSHDDARSGELAGSSRRLTRAGGSLTRMLVPILRLWRVAYRQQAA